MKEQWRKVVGYDDYYEVSNLGRVRSIDRTIQYTDGRVVHRKSKILSQKIDRGYYSVTVSKNNDKKLLKVHRLVAQAFIPNTDNLPCVNHKDENKENNSVDNLEWCTYEYNVNYGTRNRRASERLKNRPSKLKGVPKSLETRKKMSMSMKGKQNCLGRVLSDETKKKIAESNRIAHLGTVRSECSKQKQALNRAALKIDDVFEINALLNSGMSIKELSIQFNVAMSVIRKVARFDGIYGKILRRELV